MKIRNIKDLLKINDDLYGEYELANDIDFKNYKDDFIPIAYEKIDKTKMFLSDENKELGFKGIFNGNGFEIKNFLY